MGSSTTCCVCERELGEGEAHILAGRTFCAEHLARATRDRRSLTSSIVVEIGAVVLFAALVAGLGAWLRPALTGVSLVLVSVLIALVPGAIWLLAFYRQDRLEPEPKRYVLGVAALGAVLAEAIGRPLIRDVFEVQYWLYDSPVVAILGSILVIGFVQEFLKYAAVRFTVFHSPEFDERVDGIVYGAAVGLGYATTLNVRYVLDHNGVDPAVGAIQVAITALAHASFSGVVGYFLGRAKFERMGPLWLPFGLILAATLNGVVTYVLRQAPMLTDFGMQPWYALVVAAVVAGVTFGCLFLLVRRLNAAALTALRAGSGA